MIAIAGPASADAVRGVGAAEVVDYHAGRWPERVRGLTGGVGVAAAANAARGGAAQAFAAVAIGGRLATTTSDSDSGVPDSADAGLGVAVHQVYVRPDGQRLPALAELLARGDLTVEIGAGFSLDQASDALDMARSGGHGKATMVYPEPL